MAPDYIAFSGEDELSEALARRCVAHTLPNTEFSSWRPAQGGIDAVRNKFESYLNSAVASHILVMLDLDQSACPPALRSALLQKVGVAVIPPKMVLTIVKREAESWVLGDGISLASFFGINVAQVPDQPEELDDPKAALVSIARHSRAYCHDFCPRAGTNSKVGVGYNDILNDFVRDHWHPDVAAESCHSLRRTLARLQDMNGVV